MKTQALLDVSYASVIYIVICLATSRVCTVNQSCPSAVCIFRLTSIVLQLTCLAAQLCTYSTHACSGASVHMLHYVCTCAYVLMDCFQCSTTLFIHVSMLIYIHISVHICVYTAIGESTASTADSYGQWMPSESTAECWSMHSI
jgi:hypothetical protein